MSEGATSPAPAPAAAPGAPARLEALSVLRLVAALWIVTLHLNIRAPLEVAPLGKRFFANGGFAMAVFFILSGTVLAYGYHALRPRAADVIRFYQARFARIYVPYALLHLVALAWWAPQNQTEWQNGMFSHVLSALGLQAWFSGAMNQAANGGTWSISVEFFFYALFPALLPLLAYLRERHGVVRVCAYLAALSGLVGLSDLYYTNSFAYYISPVVRLPEFMIGVALGLELAHRPATPRRHYPRLLAAGAGAAFVAFFPIPGSGLWIRANAYVVPAFAWFIYELARWDQARTAPPGLIGRRLAYLGECSYALFLVHLVPLFVLDTPSGRAWLGRHWPGGNESLWVTVLALCFVAAIAVHELVENPARRWLLRRWQPARFAAGVSPPAVR